MDAAFYEVFSEEEAAIRHYLPKQYKVEFYPVTIQEAAHEAPPAPFISIRTQSIIPEQWLSSLTAILTRSTGYDHLSSLKGTNISLGYLPEYCARSVAEHVLLLLCSLLKKLPAQLESFNTFSRDHLSGQELQGKKVLVVGVGRIGSQVVHLLNAIGMHVLGYDLEKKHNDINYIGSINEGLLDFDVVVNAMNLTSDNVSYFNHAFFDRVKPGCVFINIARGECSPHDVLRHNLDKGHLGGVALDVYDNEKSLAVELRSQAKLSKPTQDLIEMGKLSNVILTPHNAFNTEQATLRKSEQAVQQLQSHYQSHKFIWQIR